MILTKGAVGTKRDVGFDRDKVSINLGGTQRGFEPRRASNRVPCGGYDSSGPWIWDQGGGYDSSGAWKWDQGGGYWNNGVLTHMLCLKELNMAATCDGIYNRPSLCAVLLSMPKSEH